MEYHFKCPFSHVSGELLEKIVYTFNSYCEAKIETYSMSLAIKP